MPPLPDTHPDGDPFAEQDALKHFHSLLGKMERNAKQEALAQGIDENGQIIKKENNSSGSSKARTSLGVNKDGKEMIVLDDSDEDQPSEGEAVATEGEDDEDEDGEDQSGTEEEGDATSGADGEGNEGSEAEEPAGVKGDGGEGEDEEDDDEDDTEDDDSEDDSASSVGTGEQAQDGDGDVSMADPQGDPDPTKPKSPVKPSTSTGEGGEANGEPKKEKKKRRRRALNRSPSPPPLEPKKPPPTIRLSVTLPPRSLPDTPQYNIVEMAKDAGILPREEIPKPKDSNSGGEESESDGQGGRRKKDKGKGKDEGGGDGPPPKKRKRGPNVILGRFGGYDTEDPFVDDTELALYEPRHYHRPKKEGYFVCIGQVECAPKRGGGGGGKRSRPSTTTKKIVIGSDGKQIVIDTPQGGASNGKIETPFGTSGVPTFGSEPPKPARKPGEFSKELEENFEMLKVESDKESYAVKNKFPPHLKELLTSVAHLALDLNEFDEYFFARLPQIFPYNKFTLTKLVKREVYPKRMNDYNKKQEELLDILKEGIAEHYEEQKKEFEELHAAWVKEKEEKENGAMKVDASSGPSTPAPGSSTIPAFGAAPVSVTGTPGGGESPAPATDGAVAEEDKEPKFKFRFNDMMRSALYWAADYEDRKSSIIEEKQKLEKSTTRPNDPEKPHNQKTARKQIYAKITALWPDGVMQTNQISREISNYKLKLKKAGEIEA
ncbi:hypothetical protein JCM3765_003649 [Sporobolomyces pararoseus]